MARSREQIDADIRAQTPEIVVTDGPRRDVYRPGDPAYEVTVARWADQHFRAEQEIERDEAELEAVRALLPVWERGTPEQRVLVFLLRRAGVT